MGWGGGKEWIDLAEDRYSCGAFVNAMVNLCVHKMWGISWLAEDRLNSEERFCSMELAS